MTKLITFGVSILLAGSCFADTWTVDDDGKADFNNIQDAIDAASDGDEIIVMPGTYTSDADEVVNTSGKAITLTSTVRHGAIIDGEGVRRGVVISNEEIFTTAITGFLIQNCHTGGSGGAILLYNCSPTISECRIIGNNANDEGGGVHAQSSSPTWNECEFIGNTAHAGGGMYNGDNSNPTLTNCTFASNAVTFGGGMFNWDSSPLLSNCTFEDNTAFYHGGGMYNNTSSSPTLDNCTFTNNIASDYGGGILNYYNSSPTLTNCTFTGNTAGGGPNGYGGGMYNWDNSNPTLENCILTNNTTGGKGGGMQNYDNSNPTLTDTIVCGNTPPQISGTYTDGGGNTIADVCPPLDSDGDGVPDISDNCYLYNPDQADCNGNGIGDICDIHAQTSPDCDTNTVPDECQPDCDGDSLIDPCDIQFGGETDWNYNDIPDNCEVDCNENGIPDDHDIIIGISQDCNNNDIPDECDISDAIAEDCDGDNAIDNCQIASDPSLDCDNNGVLDVCEFGQYLEGTKLLPSDGSPGDEFGNSISVYGNTAVIGAPSHYSGNQGNAFVFRFDGNEWVEEARLTASDGSMGDSFGSSVCISGNVVIVGAYGDDETSENAGAAYIYRYDGSAWNEEQKLLANDGSFIDYFGQSVSISGDTAIVGADNDDGANNTSWETGAAYIYRFDGSEWVQEEKLLASDGASYAYFGQSVSISGDTVIVGACNDQSSTSNPGSVYIYRFNGSEWIEEEKLTQGVHPNLDRFGESVSISGDTVVVGAHFESEDGKGSRSGSSYVYRFDGNEWVEEAKLLASDGENNHHFGYGVCISEDKIIIGAWGDNYNGSATGSAYMFHFDGTEWIEEAKLLASDGASDYNFGYSVGISGDVTAIGAYHDSPNGQYSGSAYIFTSQFDSDCNNNGVFDACDLADGTSMDQDNDGIPDECEADCNSNSVPDHWDIKTGESQDCNDNGIPDECDIADSTSSDVNSNGVPDECEPDCNGNGVPDAWDIETGAAIDCNGNGIPDSCDATSCVFDCNLNGVPDECDIASGTSDDINANSIPDDCECAEDLSGDGVVGVDDLLLVIGYWGSPGPLGDFNADSTVGVDDLLILISRWGECTNIICNDGPPIVGAVQWTIKEGGNGHWYRYNWDQTTGSGGVCWSEARELCLIDGGDLVSVSSQAESDFIQLTICPMAADAGGNLGWLGLMPDGNGALMWSNGEALNWTNWDTGQPSGDGPYVAFVGGCAGSAGDNPMTWNDIGGGDGCHYSNEAPLAFWITEWSALGDVIIDGDGSIP